MKKCSRIIFSVLIFVLSITINVYATEGEKSETFSEAGKITIKASNNSIKVGGTVTVSLSASYDNGIECVNSILDYDKTKLELTNIEMKNYFSNQSGEDGKTGKFVLTSLYGDIGSPEIAPTESEYAVLTFKVLDKATVGELISIKFLENEIIAPNLDSTEIEDKELTFTVMGETKPVEEQKKPEKEKEPIEQKKEESKKDDTVANKVINKAGISKNIVTVIIAIIVISIVLYIKNKKNIDIH